MSNNTPSPNDTGKDGKAFDKYFADKFINELLFAPTLLKHGTSCGLQIVVTEEALAALRQSDHPSRDDVLGQLGAAASHQGV